MKFPLPSDTRSILGSNNVVSSNIVVSKTSNLGLLFDKYVSVWSDDWTTEEKRGKDKVNLKSDFLDKIEKQSICTKEGRTIVDSLYKRQLSIIQGLKSSGWHVEAFNSTTDSRLIIGLGGASVIETGMTLHPLYGFPYLPGSGLKGLARAYAEIAEDFPDEETKKRQLHEIFGSDNKDPRLASENIQSKVFFMDGLPTAFPRLELDIMNPHYSEYYRGDKPPADYLNPVPVTFLTVAPGQKFSFAVYSKDKDLAEKAMKWLIGGLTELGAGGKTNVGYGYFKVEDQSVTPVKNESLAIEEDDSIISRVKLIKNQQTFAGFIKGIKDDEMKALSSVSFKGMESVVNIGLMGILESAEAPAEVKKIIAQKMLEVCKEPNKKYAEKVEKYKRLRNLAGIE